MDLAIGKPKGERLLVRGKGDSGRLRLVDGHRFEQSAGKVPNATSAVARRGDDPETVGAKGQRDGGL